MKAIWIDRKPEAGTVYTFLNRSWSIVSTLVFIALVIYALSPELQGYYYTFLSLLVLLQLADMGFGSVLTQFCSHEWAHLRFDENGAVVGSPEAKARLASLVDIGFRWYGVAVMVFFVALGLGGDLFFATQAGSENIDWRLPWWLLAGFAAFCLLLVPVTSLLDASHQVALSQRNQLAANVVASFAGWATLGLGGGLYAVPVVFAGRAVLGHALNTLAARPLLRLRHGRDRASAIDWRREFWPQQWRIFASWTAGFLVFQSFTPIAFKLSGPVAAGQIGIMVQAFHAVNQLASARLTVDQPKMGALAAKGDLGGLRALVRLAIGRNILVSAILAAAAVALVYGIQAFAPAIGWRFGSLPAFTLFVLAAVLYQVSNVETAAVRFQKKEPFVTAVFVSAILVVLGNLLVAAYGDAAWMAVVFTAVSLFVLVPWVHAIYRRHMVPG
ncbi:MAG: hypothetical protein AB1781_05015 [Pseudomonadota bacterium]